MEDKKEGIQRYGLYYDYMDRVEEGDWVDYDDHKEVEGKLLMQILELKMENEAYQEYIRGLEHAADS